MRLFDCGRLQVPAASSAWVVAVVLYLPSTAAAQQPPGAPPTRQGPSQQRTRPTPVEVEAPDSPRASLRAFADLATRKGNYAGAARYLSLPAGELTRGPDLARQLGAVLERHLQIDGNTASPNSDGDMATGSFRCRSPGRRSKRQRRTRPRVPRALQRRERQVLGFFSADRGADSGLVRCAAGSMGARSDAAALAAARPGRAPVVAVGGPSGSGCSPLRLAACSAPSPAGSSGGSSRAPGSSGTRSC